MQLRINEMRLIIIINNYTSLSAYLKRLQIGGLFFLY